MPILYAILLLGGLLLVLPVALTITGLAWSPFAALICGMRARRNGLPAGQYARAGWSYSAQMLLPGIYLTTLLSGKPFTARVVRAGYILTYAMWTAVILSGIYFFTEQFLISSDSQYGPLYGPFGAFARNEGLFAPSTHIWALVFALAPLLFNLLMYPKTLRDLRRKRREDAANPKSAENRYALPDKAYTRPFSLTLFGFMLGFFAWIILIFGIYGKCAFRDACVSGL